MEYKIRTLRDIVDLPSADVMMRCLNELVPVMQATRGLMDLHKATCDNLLKGEGKPATTGPTYRFPEEITWKDDGEGKSKVHLPLSNGAEGD